MSPIWVSCRETYPDPVPPPPAKPAAHPPDADPEKWRPLFSPLKAIEAALARELAQRPPNQPVALLNAVEYAALGPGKRLRPLLAWYSCAALGAPGELSLPAGLALELVHAFSLVHDDLPAIDNDDVRRGRATLHKHAGEAMAILAGDALLTRAFELIASGPVSAVPPNGSLAGIFFGVAGMMAADEENQAAEPRLRLALIRELASATSAMVAGQVWDTCAGLPPHLSPIEQLRLIHSNKTGALIRAACRMGALCGSPLGLRDPRLRHITDYAEAIGLMFQIVDDLLDVTQSAEHTGKRTQKDADAGKLTYPAVLGVEGSWTEVDRLRDAARAAIEPLLPNARSLATLAEYLSQRTR